MLHAILFAGALFQTQQAPTHEYLIGEIVLTASTGAQVGSGVSLVRRVLDPAGSTITETVVSLDTRQPTREYTVVWKVDGMNATFEEKSGAFKGTAKLRGKPFAFTSYSATSTLANGAGTMKEKGRFSKTTMSISREMSGPTGGIQVRYEEKYRFISAESFELLRKRLVGTTGAEERK